MKISIALRGAILGLMCLSAAAALAQAPTTLPREITEPSGPLTNGQRAQVNQFVTHWAQELGSPMTASNARARIDQARRALAGTQSLNAPGGLSPHFRTAYSEALIPHLTRMLAGNDERVAVEALHLAARLGTDAGIGLVTQEIESENAHRRAAAAARARLAIEDFSNGGRRTMVAAALITTLARKTGEVAIEETEAYALQRQIDLLNAVHAAAQAQQIGALASDVEKMRKDLLAARAERLESSDVDAMIFLLDTLRDYYQFTPATQQEDGKVLAPSIEKVLEAANRDWDQVQSQPDLREAYKRLIADSESFLAFIDKTINVAQNPPTPDTRLPVHWEQRDKSQFEQDLAEWNTLLDSPPYNG